MATILCDRPGKLRLLESILSYPVLNSLSDNDLMPYLDPAQAVLDNSQCLIQKCAGAEAKLQRNSGIYTLSVLTVHPPAGVQ
jgi:hypothetical protein